MNAKKVSKGFVRRRVSIVCKGGLTKQEHKEECDINVIVARYRKIGQSPFMIPEGMAAHDFFENPIDFQKAMDINASALQKFEKLPAKVRDRFGNDPGKFLEFAHDPSNGYEMVRMGLAKPYKAPEKAKQDGEGGTPPSSQPEASKGKAEVPPKGEK